MTTGRQTMYVYISMLCLVTALEESERYLEAPTLLSVTALEPEGLYVEWSVVRQRLDDPVLGYKIRIYQVPEYVDIDTEERKDVALQEFNISSTYPLVREETLIGRVTTATVNEVKHNILYEVRVVAYKADVNGPPSEPIRIKVMRDKNYNTVVKRTREGCQISVRSGNIVLDDTYPYMYNAYF